MKVVEAKRLLGKLRMELSEVKNKKKVVFELFVAL